MIDSDENSTEVATDLPSELDGKKLSIVFEDNFDDQEDFVNERNVSCNRGSELACLNGPTGWSHFRVSERWHPDEMGESVKAGLQVTDFQHMGSTGKSMIVWDESYGGPSQWGSDSILSKRLPSSHNELYSEFYIKFQDGYRWGGIESGSGTDLAKIFRFGHFQGAPDDNNFKFFTTGSYSVLAFLDLGNYNFSSNGSFSTQSRAYTTVRCAPTSNNYYCGESDYSRNVNSPLPGKPSFVEAFGDGKWHKIGMRVKMNSAPTIGDGLLDIWYDNTLVVTRSDIPFLGSNSEPSIAWNTFMIGGNMHNVPEDESQQFEQWYAIDNLKVFSLDP